MINENQQNLDILTDEEIQSIRDTDYDKLNILNLDNKILNNQVKNDDLKNLLLANAANGVPISYIFKQYLENKHADTFDSYLTHAKNSGAL